MKVKDFLENFKGKNSIIIFDRDKSATRRYNNVGNVINDYGHFAAISWTIEENVLVITIQTQF